VGDNDPNLSGLVIKALQAAMQPSFPASAYGFNNRLCERKELYRNTHVFETCLIKECYLDSMSFHFSSLGSEVGQGNIELDFSKVDF